MATIVENIQTLQSIKSDIKNAIIQKGGSVTDAFGGYAQAITNLPSGGGGGTEMEDALVTRTFSVYSNDRVSRVGTGAFTCCSALKSVDLSNCKYIADYAFSSCIELVSINIPLCQFIGNHCFAHCDRLSSVNFPLCTSLMESAFYNDRRLQSISLPNCELIGAGAFQFCSELPFVNLPLCKSFSKDFFDRCSTFAYCDRLSIVKIPLCSYIGDYAFRSCINLKEVYLNSVSSVTTISSRTFSDCPKLTSIYVPASLVNAFKTARYWSSMSTKIVAYTEPEIGTEDIL